MSSPISQEGMVAIIEQQRQQLEEKEREIQLLNNKLAAMQRQVNNESSDKESKNA